MAKTLDELDEQEAIEAEFEVLDTDDVEDEEDHEEELKDRNTGAIELLKRCAVLFQFIADPVMCRALSKRERAAAERMVDNIYEFTDEVEEFLADEDEE